MKSWIKMAKLMSDREKGIYAIDIGIAKAVIIEKGPSDIMRSLVLGETERILIKVAESITKDEAIEYVVEHEKI